MNKKQLLLLRVALSESIKSAINEVGVSEFKKTSLFLSNERKDSN